MSVQKLPSGRWRAQIYDKFTGKNISVSKVIRTEPGTYATKTEAKQARARARDRLGEKRSTKPTVAEFREQWLTDPLFARPKKSTMIHYAERTKAFSDRYGHLPIDEVSDFIVAQYLAGGQNNSTVDKLRILFNDAASARAGRLVTVNPFAGLGLAKTRGNQDRLPPSETSMWSMLKLARELTIPSFADYLEVACFTAMRPGELDALQDDQIDFDRKEIHVTRQWSAKTREFTAPKQGAYTIALVGHAEDVLRRRKLTGSPFVFPTLRNTHFTPSSRIHHWNRVRAAAGLTDFTLYLATRHYFGWYAVNILELDTAIVAEQLGHKDSGRLVERLYGHPDKAKRRDAIKAAFHDAGQVRPLRVVNHEDGSA